MPKPTTPKAPTPPWKITVAALMRAHRFRAPREEIERLEQQLKFERLTRHIEGVLAEAPALTPEQAAGLAALFRAAPADEWHAKSA